MSRVGSGDGWDIATWQQGDNPGGGSQDFTIFTDTGLNGNWKRIWRGLKTQHNADGTHQNDVITGANIVNGIVDGTTLEATAATGAKVFRIKDVGVTTAKIGLLAVTTATIAALAVTDAKLAADAVITVKILDANVTTAKIADGAITAGKIAHDNNRTKCCFMFGLQSGDEYLRSGDIVMANPGPGIAMPRAGAITAVYVVDSTGIGGGSNVAAYEATNGLHHNHFTVGTILSASLVFGGTLTILLNYVASGHYGISPGTPNSLVTVEVEFDA